MASSVLLVFFAVFSSLSLAAPQLDDPQPTPTPIPDTPPANADSLNATWEIVIAIVLTIVVLAVVGIALWVRLRRRRRQDMENARLQLSSARATSPYRRSSYAPSSNSQDTKVDVITAPLPVLAYSERTKRASRTPSLTPPPTGRSPSEHSLN